MVRTLDADAVRVRRVPFERLDDGLLRVRAGAGEPSRLAAVLRGAEITGEVGGEEGSGLPGVSGDERDELGVRGERLGDVL